MKNTSVIFSNFTKKMIKPQLRFFLYDSKIHTVSSCACVLQPSSDHVYEVFRIISGVPLFLEDHLERLQNSMNAAGLEFKSVQLVNDIERLISLNKFETGNIKIIFWKSGLELHNMVFYDVHVYPSDAMFRDGIEIGTLEHERKNPNIKLFDSEMRTIAAGKINDNNFYEILLVSKDKIITECSRSNIFFIRDNNIVTPPANQVLEGVTRKHVIEIIREQMIPFSEKSITTSMLGNFESVFLTGTSRRVLPVRKIDPFSFKYITQHPLIIKLQELFLERCKRYIEAKKLTGKNFQ